MPPSSVSAPGPPVSVLLFGVAAQHVGRGAAVDVLGLDVVAFPGLAVVARLSSVTVTGFVRVT